MFLAGLRRLAVIGAGVVLAAAALSLLIGTALGSDPVRSLYVGFYVSGAGLVTLAVFSAGPAIAHGEELNEWGGRSRPAGGGLLALLGIVLIVLGAVIDTKLGDDGDAPAEVVAATLETGR